MVCCRTLLFLSVSQCLCGENISRHARWVAGGIPEFSEQPFARHTETGFGFCRGDLGLLILGERGRAIELYGAVGFACRERAAVVKCGG